MHGNLDVQQKSIFYVTFRGLRLTDTMANGSFGKGCQYEEGIPVMADRVVIVRAGVHLVSLPFAQIDEILGADRIQSVQDLPEGVIPEGSPEGLHPQHWVLSRGTWFPVDILLPGSDVIDSSQVVVVRWGDRGRAFAVDHVLGIEASTAMAAFPEKALPYTDVPIAGVRFRNDGLVLELDLSRLISLGLGS
jgi:hypothetical protein